jgi:hypothetical protein
MCARPLLYERPGLGVAFLTMKDEVGVPWILDRHQINVAILIKGLHGTSLLKLQPHFYQRAVSQGGC